MNKLQHFKTVTRIEFPKKPKKWVVIGSGLIYKNGKWTR